MKKTALELIQAVTTRIGLGKPTAVFGSGDPQLLQLAGLLQELTEELRARHHWTMLRRTYDWTSGGSLQQLDFVELGVDSRIFRTGTMFNLTLRRKVEGPLPDELWQARRALPATGPYYQFRISQDALFISPAVPAGHLLSFEYQTDACVIHPTSPDSADFNNDADTCAFPDDVMIAGLRMKWRQEKRLDFASDQSRYEMLVREAISHDGAPGPVRLDGVSDTMNPGIYVPAGSWMV